MSKQIASFIPNFWSPHLEVDVELIKRHVDAGDDVTVYVCHGELLSCYGNLMHDLETCRGCINRRRNAFDLLGLNGKVRIRNFLSVLPADEEILASFRGLRIQSKEQLWDLCIDDFYPGRQAYNEIACHLREIEPSIEDNAEYFSRAIESAALVYLSFKNLLKENRPDCFYTFNGRLLISHAAVAAAKILGVRFAVHEQAFMADRFFLVENESIHSLTNWNSRLQKHWENSEHSVDTRLKIAAEWFEQRKRGESQGWYSFTAEQRDELPASFDMTRTNLVIYNSSEFETVGMEDYQLKLYQSQNQAIEQIARDLLGDSAFRIYLRVHPNLKGRDNPQVRYIQKALTNTIANLEVIPADSQIGTYTLMRNADVVLTFGSTAGVEAVYQRIPSILLGPAIYQSLDCCWRPNSHEEVMALVQSRQFQLDETELEHRRVGAMKYGYFMATVGSTFQYFDRRSLAEIREKTSGQMIGFCPQPYGRGLREELKSRAELTASLSHNPLALTMKELMNLAEQLANENERLQSELAVAQARLNSTPGKIATSVHHIGGTVKRRLKRLLQSS